MADLAPPTETPEDPGAHELNGTRAMTAKAVSMLIVSQTRQMNTFRMPQKAELANRRHQFQPLESSESMTNQLMAKCQEQQHTT